MQVKSQANGVCFATRPFWSDNVYSVKSFTLCPFILVKTCEITVLTKKTTELSRQHFIRILPNSSYRNNSCTSPGQFLYTGWSRPPINRNYPKIKDFYSNDLYSFTRGFLVYQWPSLYEIIDTPLLLMHRDIVMSSSQFRHIPMRGDSAHLVTTRWCRWCMKYADCCGCVLIISFSIIIIAKHTTTTTVNMSLGR